MALANYEILQRKEFYKTNFESVIEKLIETKKNSVDVNGLVSPNKSKQNEYEGTHQKRVIRDYIVPLIYLIYSMIYIKFYNNQLVKQIKFESNLNYNMYSYVFSHKNPIIKTVNVFMYKYFEKNNSNNSTGVNKYIIDELKDGTFKQGVMKFFEDSNKLFLPDTTSADKIKIILKALKDCKIQIKSIYDKLDEIKANIPHSPPALPARSSPPSTIAINDINNITAKFSNKNYKLDTFLDSISYKGIGENKDLFDIYRTKYNDTVTGYKNLLNKTLKTINTNILYINFSNEIDEEKYGIITDNISLNNINSYINYYENLLNEELKENNVFQLIGNENKTLEGLIHDEKDLIVSFLKDKNNTNNTNNNVSKKKDLLNDIYNTKKDLYGNIYDIINNILKYTKYKKLEEAKKEGDNLIVTATDIKNIIEKSNDVFKEILKNSNDQTTNVSTMKNQGIVQSELSNVSKGAIYSCTRYIAESVNDKNSTNNKDKFKAKEEAYQALLWVCSNFLSYNKMQGELSDNNSTLLSMVVTAISSTALVYNNLKTTLHSSPPPTNNYSGDSKQYPDKDYDGINTGLNTIKYISNIRNHSTSSTLPQDYISTLDKYRSKNIDQLISPLKVITETKIVRGSSVASVLASFIALNTLNTSSSQPTSSNLNTLYSTSNIKNIVEKINQEVITASVNPEKMTVASAAILTLVNNPDSTKEDILNASRNVILDFISKNEDVFRNFNSIYKDYNEQGSLRDKIDNIYKLHEDEIEPQLRMMIYMYKSIISNEIIEFKYLNSIKSNISITNSNKIYENLDIHFKIIKQYFNNYEKTFKKYRKEGDKGFDLFIKNLKDKKSYFLGIIEDYNNDIKVVDDKILPITTSKTAKITNKSTKENEKKKLDEKKKRYEDSKSLIQKIGNQDFQTARRILRSYIKTENSNLLSSINKVISNKENTTSAGRSQRSVQIKEMVDVSSEKINDKIKETKNIKNKINTTTTTINANIKNLSTKEKDYTDKKSIMQIMLDNYNIFLKEIDTIIVGITSKQTKQSSDKELINDLFTSEFKEIINISKNLYEKNNEITYDSSKNKVYHLYSSDKIELNKCINSILTIDTNTYNNFNAYSKLNKNEYKKNHDLNTTLNNSNVQRYLIEDNITNLTRDLTKYFNNEYNNEDTSNFLKKIFIIQDTNKKDITKPFFDQYKNYHDKLMKQIQDILTQIDNEELILNSNLINYIGLQNFITQLQKKKQKRDKITKHAINDDNHPKGKYTVVLPYTDIMYLYFINLLIIIDYLKYFYK